MGRQLLSETPRWKKEKIQRIRKNEKRMREKTRQNDNRVEKRDSKTKSSYEKKRGLTASQSSVFIIKQGNL